MERRWGGPARARRSSSTARLLPGAVALAAAVGLPSVAAASTASAVAAGAPAGAGRRAGCYLWSNITVTASAPVLTSGRVRDTGTWEQSPVYCPYPTGWVGAQTKVCGFWGCSWETRGRTADVTLNASPMSRTATQDCRDGTNRYRTRAYIETVHLDSQNGVPILASDVNSQDDPKQPEFTC